MADPNWIRVVPPDDPAVFAEALREALQEATAERGLRDRLTGWTREELSWAAYRRRYSQAILERM